MYCEVASRECLPQVCAIQIFSCDTAGTAEGGEMARDSTITMGGPTTQNLSSFILGFPTDASATPPLGARTPMHNNPIYETHGSTSYFGRSRPGRGLSSANEVLMNDTGHVDNLFQEEHSKRREERESAGLLADEGPVSPVWNRKRPFLTGAHLWQNNQPVFYGSGDEEFKRPAKMSRSSEDCSSSLEVAKINSMPETPRLQENVILDDLLNGFMGLNGRYISFEFPHHPSGKKDVICNLQAGLDPGLHASVCRVLPVCEDVVVLQQFVETRLKRESGMVCHAVAAAIRGILDDWLLLVTQLENLLRMGRLTMQSLWHYINPPSSVIKLLAKFAREAASQQLVGRSLLNLLHHHLRISTGNRTSQSVLQKLLEAACVPYFEILEKWLCEGILDDPYGEFIIQENPNVGLLSTTHDLQSAYWRHRYSLRWSSPQFEGDGRMPNFLEEYEEMIVTTGKYLSALRECGKPVRNLLGTGSRIKYDPSNQYVHQIHKAHEAAGKAFLEFFMKDLNLIQWLRGIKHFFLIDRGDLIMSLLDFADEEFAKQPNLVSHTRMQSLLELAVRTSSIPQDTDSAPLAFGFDSRSLLEMARAVFKRKTISSAVQRSQVKTPEERNIAQNQTKDLKGFQVFTLSYRVDWPMTLVVAPKHMQQYQLLFRHMFLLKKLERDLGKVWQTLQISRRLQTHRYVRLCYMSLCWTL